MARSEPRKNPQSPYPSSAKLGTRDRPGSAARPAERIGGHAVDADYVLVFFVEFSLMALSPSEDRCFNALALGATGVGFGRPQAWGLAAFGQSGVEAVLTIFRRELEKIMRQAGTTSLDKITAAYLVNRAR